MEENIIAKATFSKRNAFTVIGIVLLSLAATCLVIFKILLSVYGKRYTRYVLPFTMSAFVFTLLGGITLIAARCIYKMSKLTVTDKKIIGTDAFGRKVELPIKHISAIALTRAKTLTFSTSSGRIAFSWIVNYQEIFDCVSKLIEKQNSPEVAPRPTSVASVLKEYKELLDSGIITQEEFDAKKKQILGL